MDNSAFTSEAPGKLVDIDDGEKAFVPNPLPPGWTFPARLWPLLSKAKCSMSLLEGIGRQVSTPDLLIRPLQNLEALRSSALEGTYATPEELLLYEMELPEVNSGPDAVKDWKEVFNYTKSLQYGLNSELPISGRLIKEMHHILLSGVRGDEKTPGEFRRRQVYIGANHRFIPPPAQLISEAVSDLEKYVNNISNDYDPLVACYLMHYQFETIHPFLDGNGRIGRLLLALMTHKWCGFSKPWLYMSSYFDKHKESYIQKLYNVSAKNDWESWIAFCLEGTVLQAEDTISRCDKLRRLREAYISKISDKGGDARIMVLIDSLFGHPIIKIVDAVKLLDVSYPTAKSDIERLVSLTILEELSGHIAKAKTYWAPEIVMIAYRDES